MAEEGLKIDPMEEFQRLEKAIKDLERVDRKLAKIESNVLMALLRLSIYQWSKERKIKSSP